MDPTNNELPTPVNPVITPTGNTEPATMPAEPVQAPTMPTFNPATMATPDVPGVGFSATDPITMPEPVKEPDPVELELNAPFKAADPVPGSIGSAISMPEQPTEPVAQPTMQQPMMDQQPMAGQPMAGQPMANPMMANAQPASAKKKMSKTTLTLLCVLAGITVVALVAVLIIELNK